MPMIVELLKVSRQSYYQKSFEQNENNSKILRQVINNIIYSKIDKKSTSPSSVIADRKNVTHPQYMAEHFNNFFNSVGKGIQDNIPPSKNNFKNYLKTRNPNNFILSPTTPEQISGIIQTLKLNKSTGHNSSCLKVLKSIKQIISVPLCELIKKSFTLGFFPSMCKIQKQFQFSKTNQDSIRLYRPISLLSTIGKIIENVTHIRLIKF